VAGISGTALKISFVKYAQKRNDEEETGTMSRFLGAIWVYHLIAVTWFFIIIVNQSNGHQRLDLTIEWCTILINHILIRSVILFFQINTSMDLIWIDQK